MKGMELMLTPEEKQFYDENGFILKKALASPEEIEKICEEIEDIHNRMAEQPAEGLVSLGKSSMILPYPHGLSS